MSCHQYHKLYVVVLSLLVSACVVNPVQQAPVQEEVSPSEQRHVIEELKVPRQLKDDMLSLYDSDPVERAWAAYRLAKLGQGAAPAVPHLGNLLQDDTAVLMSRYLGGGFRSSTATTPAEEAARALAKIGQPAIELLIDNLSNPNPQVRRLAAKALGQTGSLSTVDPLVRTLSDQDPTVRASAAIALGSLRHPLVAQKLLDAYSTVNPDTRIHLIYAMSQINDIIVVPFLVEIFPTQSPEVRAAIVHALGKIRDARAIDTLLMALKDPDEIVRANAAFALSSFYSVPIMDALVDKLSDDVSSVRAAAMEALAALTSLNFGQDPDKWISWWQRERKALQNAQDSPSQTETGTDRPSSTP